MTPDGFSASVTRSGDVRIWEIESAMMRTTPTTVIMAATPSKLQVVKTWKKKDMRIRQQLERIKEKIIE